MAATGDCWKPFCYLLEDAGFNVTLARDPLGQYGDGPSYGSTCKPTHVRYAVKRAGQESAA